jgi:hypothetical protein
MHMVCQRTEAKVMAGIRNRKDQAQGNEREPGNG